jgi:hypothetical protein
VTENTTTAISGEVIDTAEGSAEMRTAMLKENETIIRKNWKAVEEKSGNVYRALTLIHTHNLWKLHKDSKGKRKYTNFQTYLTEEFGWTLTRVRALQIIKATRNSMIEAGELPASAGEPKTRTAPEVSTEKAAKVTADQLDKTLAAFGTRVANIDEGDPDRQQIVNLYNDAYEVIGSIIGDLREIVARITAEAESENAPAEAVAV